MAHAAHISQGRIYTARTKDEFGYDAYYVVQVSPAKERAFLNAMSSGAIIDYRAFGQLLASGFGHHPSPSVRAMLLANYHYTIPDTVP